MASPGKGGDVGGVGGGGPGPAPVDMDVESLKLQLATEKTRNAALQRSMDRMQRAATRAMSEGEAEEERITNTLLKKVSVLTTEKGDLTRKVADEERELARMQLRLDEAVSKKTAVETQLEKEQEYIFNKLQKKLDLVSREKADLERKLNSVQGSVRSVTAEREELAKQVAAEESFMKDTLEVKLRKVREERIELERRVESEQEYIVNKLHKRLTEVMEDKRELELRLAEEMGGLTAHLTSILDTMAGSATPEGMAVISTLREEIVSYPAAGKKSYDEPMSSPGSGGTSPRKPHRRSVSLGGAAAGSTGDASGEILRLKNENFGLRQKLAQLEDRATRFAAESSRLTSHAEQQTERMFNRRTSAASLTATGSSPTMTSGISRETSFGSLSLDGEGVIGAPLSATGSALDDEALGLPLTPADASNPDASRDHTGFDAYLRATSSASTGRASPSSTSDVSLTSGSSTRGRSSSTGAHSTGFGAPPPLPPDIADLHKLPLPDVKPPALPPPP